jgi:hypothetical protein
VRRLCLHERRTDRTGTNSRPSFGALPNAASSRNRVLWPHLLQGDRVVGASGDAKTASHALVPLDHGGFVRTVVRDCVGETSVDAEFAGGAGFGRKLGGKAARCGKCSREFRIRPPVRTGDCDSIETFTGTTRMPRGTSEPLRPSRTATCSVVSNCFQRFRYSSDTPGVRTVASWNCPRCLTL